MSNLKTIELPKRASRKQVQANRLNAQKSTGPKTAGGKARSSQNASTHRIFSSQIVLPGECQADFDHLRRGLIVEHRPQTLTELFLVDRIVQSMWRMNRVEAAEEASHQIYHEDQKKYRGQSESADCPARAMAEILYGAAGDSSVLEKLHRYEKRLEGTLHRSLRELQKLRTVGGIYQLPSEPSPFLPPEEVAEDQSSEHSETETEQAVAPETEILQNEPNPAGAGFEMSEALLRSHAGRTATHDDQSMEMVSGVGSGSASDGMCRTKTSQRA